MKTLMAVGALTLMSLSAHAAVVTSEGRVDADNQPALSSERSATYNSAPSASLPSAAASAEKQHGAPKADAAKSLIADKVYRDKSVTWSSRAAYYRIFDAGVTLRDDRDGDGYHREFRVRFDADSYLGDQLVYAKMYVRRVGDTSGWQLYHITDDFWIFGTSGSDDYYVSTILDRDFPTAEYDVLIDLYESGYSGIVATIGPSDEGALAYVPLEEAGLDTAIQIGGYSINGISTSLLIDTDRDGFYSKFRVTLDPDTDTGTRYAYAVLWVRPKGGTWIKEATSADFPVDASGTADAFSFTADWLSGYPTGYYDVQIDLYDAATGMLAATAGTEWSSLALIPLEDAGRDTAVSVPSNPPPRGSTTSYEHGGGAMGEWSLLALIGLVGARFMHTRYRRRRELLAIRASSPRR